MKNCVEQLRGLVTRHLTSDHQWPSDRNWRAEFGAFSGFSPHHLSTVWLDRTVTICTNTQKPSFPRNRIWRRNAHPPNFTCLCNFKGRTGWTHNCAISIYPSPISVGAHRINIRTLRLQSKCHHYNNTFSVLRSCGGKEVLCSLYMWIFILNNHCYIGNFKINKKYWLTKIQPSKFICWITKFF